MSEVDITSLSHEGRGVANVNGKVHFIAGALPTERVTYTVTRKKRQFNEAYIEECLSPAPDRVPPPCPHYGLCGGCSLQHMAEDAQVSFKQSVLAELLEKVGRCQPDQWLEPMRSDSHGYRRKARIGVRYVHKKDSVLVGFRERNGRFIADMDSCHVLDERMGKRIAEVREALYTLEMKREIAQIELACDDERMALVFRNLDTLPEADIEVLKQLGNTLDAWIYLQPKGPDTVHRIWPNEDNELLSYTLMDGAITIEFSPMDFTQVNAGINQKMVPLACELLDPRSTDYVLDAFCGLGNFSLPLGMSAGHVLGVEVDEPMILKARENAKKNGFQNVEFQVANCFIPLKDQAFVRPFDKCLLDPPRAGAEALCQDMHLLGPKRIVYISCHAATLARDAEILVHKQGYRMIKAGLLDMFPHTAHMESIAVFER